MRLLSTWGACLPGLCVGVQPGCGGGCGGELKLKFSLFKVDEIGPVFNLNCGELSGEINDCEKLVKCLTLFCKSRTRFSSRPNFPSDVAVVIK